MFTYRDTIGGYGFGPRRPRRATAIAHSGTYREALGWHQRDAAQAAQGDHHDRQRLVNRLLVRAADTRFLRAAWEDLAAGGQAPGGDGLRYAELDRSQVMQLLRDTRRALLDGTYRLGPVQQRAVPKASGRGTRTLTLTSVIDRTVERSLLLSLQPLLDPVMDDQSYGFRPRRDRRHALARAERLAAEGGRYVWAAADIRDAFDNIPRRRLMDIVRRLLPEDRLLALLEHLIVTSGKRGVRQGSPLSGLWLNLYLDNHLHRPWRRQCPGIPLLRMADDLLLICQVKDEAEDAYGRLTELLISAGMPLKGDAASSIHNLAHGTHIDWLGYRLQLDRDDLQVRIQPSAWTQLERCLAQLHESPNAPLHVAEVLNGWVSQLGPMYPHPNREMIIRRIMQMARALGYEELPPFEAMEYCWMQAYEAYADIRHAKSTRHARKVLMDGVSQPQ